MLDTYSRPDVVEQVENNNSIRDIFNEFVVTSYKEFLTGNDNHDEAEALMIHKSGTCALFRAKEQIASAVYRRIQI